MTEHEPFIREAIHLAELARVNGDDPFGSLLVHEGKVLLRAQNLIHTMNDISLHPESMLARAAASRYDSAFLSEVTLYTSTEPCVMCTGAIYWSGIGRIVFACSEKRLSSLTSSGMHLSCRDVLAAGERRVEVIGPILEDEAMRVHDGYWG